MPELRKDPVSGRWVIISTDRRKRPHDFRFERAVSLGREQCPFCPGHEAMTPPDEIYLAEAAWLAMNRAEIRTSRVDSFALKGFVEPVVVHRIEQTHRTRVIADQYIVATDLKGFTSFADNAPPALVEAVLDPLRAAAYQCDNGCYGRNVIVVPRGQQTAAH